MKQFDYLKIKNETSRISYLFYINALFFMFLFPASAICESFDSNRDLSSEYKRFEEKKIKDKQNKESLNRILRENILYCTSGDPAEEISKNKSPERWFYFFEDGIYIEAENVNSDPPILFFKLENGKGGKTIIKNRNDKFIFQIVRISENKYEYYYKEEWERTKFDGKKRIVVEPSINFGKYNCMVKKRF